MFRVKSFASRGHARVKRSASRGVAKKWILIVLVVLLLIPAVQVAVVRFTLSLPLVRPFGLSIYVARFPSTPFINPPVTLPMLIDQGNAHGSIQNIKCLGATPGSASGSGTHQRMRMSHAKRTASPARTVGAACALLLIQRRIPPLCGNPHSGKILDALAGA
ncbi:MAG TPA: hypothetical protein VLH17_07040 [Candidatus Binatia bacterium]|nr:hypothetical protein [Candidatus Binatia bacterium]